MQKLDREGPLTLTYQLTEILRERIANFYDPGALLPSEKELVQEFNVSNITVRNALENLVIEGIVTRKRGKGTFVSEKKISSNITRLQSGTQLFQESGMTSHVELLEAVKVKANLPTATQFGLPEGALFNTLTRRRMLDAVPYSLETSYIPQEICPDISDRYQGGSLYEFREKQYGIFMTRSEEIYTAVALHSKQAKLLHQERGAAALLLRGRVYDQNDRLVAVEESLYRSDKFEIVVQANSSLPRPTKLIEPNSGGNYG